jgi:hypothetical protein
MLHDQPRVPDVRAGSLFVGKLRITRRAMARRNNAISLIPAKRDSMMWAAKRPYLQHDHASLALHPLVRRRARPLRAMLPSFLEGVTSMLRQETQQYRINAHTDAGRRIPSLDSHRKSET